MKFKPGESVVCINDEFKWARKKYAMFKITWPVRGKCYVVRQYVISGSHPALVLQGIKNPRVRYNDGSWREAGFWEERFERAPGIEDLKKAADDVSRWLPNETETEKEREQEDA
jgi:hypothetical protein